MIAITAASPAIAKPKRSKTARVKRYKKKAFRLFAKGKWDKGIAQMKKAHALKPHPGFLLNIAVAYDRWGDHCDEALATFDQFFEDCPDCALKPKAEESHADVRERCRVEVTFGSTPSGAQLEVDGRAIGAAPTTARLDAGPHTVVAIRPGYARAERSFDAVRAGPNQVEVTLEALPPPPPVAAAPPPPPPTAAAPPPSVTTPAPSDDEGGVSPWTWTAFGVAAAGLAIGSVFTVQTLQTLDDEEAAREARRPKREIELLQAEATDRAIVANVGFGAAAAGLAVGTILLIVDLSGDDDPESAAVVPEVGPGFVGLSGRF